MKRLFKLAAIGTTASAVFAILLSWEIVANAQNLGKPPETAHQAADTTTVDPANKTRTQNNSLQFGPLTANADPIEIVTRFLEALRQGNKEDAKKMLTETARKKCEEADLSIAPPGSPRARFGITSVNQFKGTPDQPRGHVEAYWLDVDEKNAAHRSETTWVLHKEREGWRIAGSIMKNPDQKPPLELDFENPAQMQRQLTAVYETAANADPVAMPAGDLQYQHPQPSATATASSERASQDRLKIISLKHAPADNLAETLKATLRTAGKNAIIKGAITIVADLRTNSLILTGSDADLSVVEALAAKLDTSVDQVAAVAETPVSRNYPVGNVNSGINSVLEKMFADSPGVQLNYETTSRGIEIIAVAKPSQHAIIDRTIELLQKASKEMPQNSKAQVAEPRRGERDVFAQVDGVVAEVLVKHGDEVKAGQELVKLKNPELEMRLKQIAADGKAAGAKVDKMQRLYDGGQINIDELLAAKALNENLIVQDELNQKKLQLLTVKSPIEGKVVTWNLRESLIEKPVAKGEMLLTLAMKGVSPAPATFVDALNPVEGQAFPPTGHPTFNPMNPYSVSNLPSYSGATAINGKAADSPYQKAEQKAGKLATKYRELTLGSSTPLVDPKLLNDPAAPSYVGGLRKMQKDIDDLKAEIRCEVENAFKARQKAQQTELESLRKKLNQIETSLNNREKNREAIINRRVEELINPDVKWDAASAVPPPHSNRNPPSAAIGPASDQRLSHTRATLPATSIPIPRDSDGVNDDPAIGGVWAVISQTEGGRDRMGIDDPYHSCTITGNKMSFIRKSNRRAEEFIFKLDPTHQPKWIDVSTVADNWVCKGIYELDGDMLTICIMAPNADRSTEFESKPNSGAMLFVLQRVHLTDALPTPVPSNPPPASDHEAILGEWKVESGLEGGKPAEHLPTKMVISKDFLIMTDGKETHIANYKLDPTKSPKWIDVQHKNDLNPPKAIYKLQGDELILCVAKGEGNKDERPTAFESKPDSPNYNLIVFKREKPQTKPQAATVPVSPRSTEYDPFAQLPGLVAVHDEKGRKLLGLQVSDDSLVPTAPDSATAQQLLQGKWSILIACDEGENRLLDQTNIPPSERLKGCVVEDSTLTFQMEDGTTQAAKFNLDPKHYPSWIDLEIGNRVFKGIYELNPKNATLTICYPEGPTKKRSTGFFSGANSENDVLLVFRRASPAQQTRPADATSIQRPKLEPNDADAIQGTWLPEATLAGGQFHDSLLKVIFTKNTVAFHNDDPGISRGFHKLDASKSPKWIDLLNLDGKSYKGIYQLEGDELKICFPINSKDERPDTLEATQEPANKNLIILIREAGTKKRPH